MNNKYIKKISVTLLCLAMLLSLFGVVPVFASVENGNLVADVLDNHADSSKLPSYWALNSGDASAVTVQNGAISINNAEASDAVSVNVYSPDEAGSRKLTTQLYKNSLIEFKARKNSDVTTYFEMCGGGSNNTMFRISFEANGWVKVHNCRTTDDKPNGSYKLANVYNLNEFFTVKVHVVSGTGNRLISVWVNDKLVVDGAHFNATSIISVKTGRFVVPAKTDDTATNFEVTDYFVKNLDVQSSLDDATAIDAAKELITYRDILNANQSKDYITENITLPTGVAVVNPIADADGNVENDVEIEWQSDNEDVINSGTGEVTRPTDDNPDATVTLTAFFRKGNEDPVKKEFEFFVPRIFNPVFEAHRDLEISTSIGVETDKLFLPDSGSYDAEITWKSDNPEIIDNEGNITMPEEQTVVSLVATVSVEGYEPKLKRFNVLVIPDTGDSLLAGANVTTNGLVAEYIPACAIDGDVNTFWKSSKEGGSSIEFYFDEPKFINKFVLRGITSGVRTYTINYSMDSGEWQSVCFKSRNEFGADVFETESFEADSLQLYIESATGEVGIAEIYAYSTVNGSSNSVTKDIEWLTLEGTSNIKDDIDLPTVGKYGSEISWESGNKKVISDSGEVTRPKSDSSAKVSVTLTATVTDGESSDTKTFIVKVVPIVNKNSGGGGGGGSKKGGSSSVVLPSLPVNPDSYVPEASKPDESQRDSEHKFSDVDDSHWAREHIYGLYKKGIVSGVTENTFEPERSITRGEFVKLIVTALKLEAKDNANVFDDVKADDWYAPYVAAAVENEIATGISGTEFAPNHKITRQEMAVMICRALEKSGIEITETENEITFDDEEKIADWAKESVKLLTQAGIINGTGTGFSPEDNATRAQAAKLISFIVK